MLQMWGHIESMCPSVARSRANALIPSAVPAILRFPSAIIYYAFTNVFVS
jgi:hypothetical protein